MFKLFKNELKVSAVYLVFCHLDYVGIINSGYKRE